MKRIRKGVIRIDKKGLNIILFIHLSREVLHSHIYTVQFNVISEHKEYNWIYF